MRIAQYEYSEKIGQGSFGTIYKGKNINTGENVVVKTEPYDIEYSSIRHESVIMNMLYSKYCRSIPPTYWYGIIPDSNERVLVMPMYQESLEDFVLKFQGRIRMSNEYRCNIMRSMIRILGHIHSKYVVHRDVKPANWMIHRDELMLIDFGMASFYVDSEENHLKPANPLKTCMIGTPKYASLNVHGGEEYSRRDDLMSVVYIGLFMLYGSNLWSNPPAILPGTDKTALSNTLNMWFKTQKSLDLVLEMTANQWPELSEFANVVYGTKFDETPDYAVLENMFSL
jgi:casein kinase 1